MSNKNNQKPNLGQRAKEVIALGKKPDVQEPIKPIGQTATTESTAVQEVAVAEPVIATTPAPIPTEETNGIAAKSDLEIGFEVHQALKNGLPISEAIKKATEVVSRTPQPKTVICDECKEIVDIDKAKMRGDYFVCEGCSGKPIPVKEEIPAPVIVKEVGPNYMVFDAKDKEKAVEVAKSKSWKMIFLMDILGATTEDSFVVYSNTLEMPGNMANIINKLEQNNPAYVTTFTVTPAPAVSSTKKGKTQGIYEITSNFDPKFSFKGSSSQIEVCTRDYMSWCVKDKAPKAMQAEYDRVKKENKESDPKKIFSVRVLQVANTTDELRSAKDSFGLSNKGGKPQTEVETDKSKAPSTAPEETKSIGTDGANEGQKADENKEAQENEPDGRNSESASAVV